jgi:GxxExxY protein
MTENELGTLIIESAIAIHRQTGPGLLESVYEAIMAAELRLRGLAVQRQVLLPVNWKGTTLDRGFRIDLLIAEKVIVEIKSVEAIQPAHLKQVQTYLRLSGCKLGYLLNFGAPLMKDGIHRCVNGL